LGQRFWFFPALDFWSYVKKYPFVFLFSLLSAFSGIVDLAFHLILLQRQDIVVPGFYSLVRCLQLGLPLFALIHLGLNSPLLKKWRSPGIWNSLGLCLLFVFFLHFTGTDVLDDSFQFVQVLTFFILAVLLLPTLQRLDSPSQQWAYLTDLVLTTASAFLVFSVFGTLFDFIYSHFPATILSNFLENPGIDNMGFSKSFMICLILPWYFMGCLDKNLDPKQKAESEGAAIGTALAYSAIVGVLIGFVLDAILLLSWFFSKDPITPEYVYFLICSCLMGLASLVMLTPLNSGKNESWIGDYRRIVAGFSLLVLAYGIFALFKAGQQWDSFGYSQDVTFLTAGYPQLILSLWLFGSMVYYFLKKEASWAKPGWALLILMGLTLFGPLSPQDVAFRKHRADLEKIFKDAGMLKDGHVVKPAASLDREPYNKLQEEIGSIASFCGLSRLQPWFTFDLKPLESVEENEKQSGGYLVASRLIQALGVEECNTVDYKQSARHFMTKYGENIFDIAGFSQQQTINFGPGCPLIQMGVNDKSFVTGLTDQNRKLTLQYGSKFLADIPLGKVCEKLKAYDYNEIIRSKVPQEDLVVEYEDPKLKVKIYLRSVEAFKTGEEIRITSGNGILLVQPK